MHTYNIIVLFVMYNKIMSVKPQAILHSRWGYCNVKHKFMGTRHISFSRALPGWKFFFREHHQMFLGQAERRVVLLSLSATRDAGDR